MRALGADARADERVVRDGKILTAAGVSAGIDLALWLVGEMFGAQQAQAACRAAATAQQARTVLEPGNVGEFARLSAAVPQLAWRSAIRRVGERGKGLRRPAT
ncbi:hypothetical protein IU427_17145 [Nocardia beijingensis]|uniref:hypothetical protein n=1 Tax=Nocardia beijingensis TaxID=95162 RepID=UPI001895CF27|nr:hypothetical protein [Nocardia beijingensis]MBF6466894.1 hypothetical protein [Nocardia beijingensis]